MNNSSFCEIAFYLPPGLNGSVCVDALDQCHVCATLAIS